MKYICTVDRLFDVLNSRNPLAKGFKAPLRLSSQDTWQEVSSSSGEYLLSLKTNTLVPLPLSTSQRKTFIIGFVTCIKSTISVATQMLSSPINAFSIFLLINIHQTISNSWFPAFAQEGGGTTTPKVSR